MVANIDRLTNLFFEVGSLRKLARSHRQTLLTDDLSDNIASHSYRVAVISYFLAKEEGADPYKTLLMALFHDVSEARSGDQNWVHKRYVKVFDDEILKDQFEDIVPDNELYLIMQAYEERESLESKLAKDADLLDQILLLKEYANNGNAEAVVWLEGKEQEKRLFSSTAKALANSVYGKKVHSWWSHLWVSKRR